MRKTSWIVALIAAGLIALGCGVGGGGDDDDDDDDDFAQRVSVVSLY